MTADQRISAARYLRMSTEHQQYSLENQSAAIQKYAESRGFKIVQTYFDTGKSGVALKRRTGLSQLLQDVVAGTASYRAILVYDVTRWGRFQDTDESAHYEFLCKSAGVPVHYCAETFANDGSLPSLIMKALKRTMAGEYSRELGVKVLDGQRRLAQLGFKQGGLAGYGLRRMLISADGARKQLLATGERKSIATDRVIVIPGPEHEVKIVRDIYRMLISEGRTVYSIARELNQRRVAYIEGSPWDYRAVYVILSHPKYIGCHVFGRTSSRLYTPTIKLPEADWILAPSAFEPIIDQTTFAEAQRILHDRTINKSSEDILDSLRELLAREKRLSLRLIQNSLAIPSPSAYRQRFGSLRRAYELIGYGRPNAFGPIDLRRRTQAMRDELISRIAEMFADRVSIERRSGRWRKRLRMKNGPIISVLVSRAVQVWKSSFRWTIDPLPHERRCVTLLARLNEHNDSFLDFHVFRKMDRRRRFHILRGDPWLNRGLRLTELSEFCNLVTKVRLPERDSPSEPLGGEPNKRRLRDSQTPVPRILT